MSEPAVPPERLSPAVRTQWRLELAGAGLALTVVGLVVALFVLDGALATLAWLLPAVGGTTVAVLVPGLRYRRWRFGVTETEIDLRHGGLQVTRVLVPMQRVQHVDSSAGVVEQVLHLATVTVYTAGGAVSIPGLAAERAALLHRRIAGLARLTTDD